MFELTKIITIVILPPFNILLLWLFAQLCVRLRWKKLAYCSTFLGISLLYFLSIPYTSKWLNDSLIQEDNLTLSDYRSAQAIVLLGGGIRDSKELYATLTTSHMALERVRYTAFLQRETQLPLLITGATPNGISEAKVMANELAMFYHVPTQWKEERAKTTKENAIFSKQILEQVAIHKIILVTNQWHMQRAKMLFEKQGFEVLPASVGTGITPHAYEINLMYFLPQAGAMLSNAMALKEWFGYWKEKYSP